MAVLVDNTDRKLIPAWKPLNASLYEVQPLKMSPRPKGDINIFVKDWNNNPNIANAGDLLTAAIIHNQEELPEVVQAAKFVIEANNAPVPLVRKAHEVVEDGTEFILDPTTFIETCQKISELKKALVFYPKDAIRHIEIARCYLTLGQLDKAGFHVKCALSIDSNNRYIVRCATRFFVHLQDMSKALNVVRSSSLTASDPWLLASEISISQIIGKSSRHIKKGIKMIESNNYAPLDLSELRSAIGTEEFINGAYSKSRRLFNDSLSAPNSNSFAQACWISSSKGMEIKFNPHILTPESFIEANSYSELEKGNYKKALEYAEKWIELEPYSTRTILYAYNIASNYLCDSKKGIKILGEAVKSHGNNPVILNDYAYSLAMDGSIVDASKIISKAKACEGDNSDIIDICITATKGLIAFRQGDRDKGTALYLDSIRRSFSHQENPSLNHSALLNYCRESLIFDNSSKNKETIIGILSQISIDEKNVELQKLKKQVEDILKDKN